MTTVADDLFVPPGDEDYDTFKMPGSGGLSFVAGFAAALLTLYAVVTGWTW